jgi:hypothetical protein
MFGKKSGIFCHPDSLNLAAEIEEIAGGITNPLLREIIPSHLRPKIERKSSVRFFT